MPDRKNKADPLTSPAQKNLFCFPMRLTSHSSFFALVIITLFPLSFCSSKLATTYKEDFEGDKKGSYTNEKVKLAGGEWTFEDALIGST
jgi:hypothetical protein